MDVLPERIDKAGGLKMNVKRIIFPIFILIFSHFCVLAKSGDPKKSISVGLCRPAVKQIRNVEEMFERDIINLKKIKLVCIYHENELTNYKPAYDYVERHQLSWVKFMVIRGSVKTEKLFVENRWSKQFKEIFDQTQGLIFSGGMDIPPLIYGKENRLHTYATTPIRTMYEVSFLFHLIGGSQNPDFLPFLKSRPDYPVLGLCLGAQTMNVAAGGTLYQDIPSEIYQLNSLQQVLAQERSKIHTSSYLKRLYPIEKDLPPAFHRIRFKSKNRFIKQLGIDIKDNPYVLTSHHQSIKKLGQKLRVVATSMDGKVVEIIEHLKFKNVVGLQFHPEVYNLYKKAKYYRSAPGKGLDFNLRYFLEANPPSMKFHHVIWRWFSNALVNQY